MSARETLLAAVATALAGVAGGRIYRSRQEQIDTLPAINILPDAESAQEYAIGAMDRRLTVNIHVMAKGDTPDTAADATLASAWAALAAAPTLGLGSDVQMLMAHEVDWEFEDYDFTRATLRVTYLYRTTTGSM